jgi:hypothetical protein
MYARVGLIFLLMLFWLTPLREVFGNILLGLTHFSLNLLGVPPFGNIGLQ